jgi:hypothetical protein
MRDSRLSLAVETGPFASLDEAGPIKRMHAAHLARAGPAHPAPRLVVGQVVVQRNSVAQMRKGGVMIAFAILDLPTQHGRRNGENVNSSRTAVNLRKELP